MLLIWCWCSPECHHTITHIFVEGPTVVNDYLRDGGQVLVHSLNLFGCNLVIVSARFVRRKIVLQHELLRALLCRISKFREAPNVSKKNANVSARATQRGKVFGAQQLLNNILRDDLCKDSTHAALFFLFKHDAVSD